MLHTPLTTQTLLTDQMLEISRSMHHLYNNILPFCYKRIDLLIQVH